MVHRERHLGTVLIKAHQLSIIITWYITIVIDNIPYSSCLHLQNFKKSPAEGSFGLKCTPSCKEGNMKRIDFSQRGKVCFFNWVLLPQVQQVEIELIKLCECSSGLCQEIQTTTCWSFLYWIMATNSQPQETPEYRTFREHYDRLVTAMLDPPPLSTYR